MIELIKNEIKIPFLVTLSVCVLFCCIAENVQDVGEREPYDECLCDTYTCTCCGTLEVVEIGINDTFCVEVGYSPDDYGVFLAISVDCYNLLNVTFSAKNPPPICALPIPELEKIVHICLRLYNVDIIGSTFHACLKLEIRLFYIFDVEEVDLGCFKLGGLQASQVEALSAWANSSKSGSEKLVHSPSHLTPDLFHKFEELKRNSSSIAAIFQEYKSQCTSKASPAKSEELVFLIIACLILLVVLC